MVPVPATADDLFGDASDISSDDDAEPPPKPPEDGDEGERVRRQLFSYQLLLNPNI